MDPSLLAEIFLIFNTSGDGSMGLQEFVFCWNMWIKKVTDVMLIGIDTLSKVRQIVRPKSAIIIVDVQNDFISGSLSISNCPAGHNGEDVSIIIIIIIIIIEDVSIIITLITIVFNI